MIFSSIHAYDNVRNYPAATQKAIAYLTETDFDKLEDGVYEIDGQRMYAQVFHNTSKPVGETRTELHRQYVDVQFWVSGEELFGIAPSNGVGSCVEAIDERDLYFYDGVANESFVHATQGCYAVFFTNDAHRPGVCVDGKPLKYRKVVVKVSCGLL